ncbi:hypothetical protein OsJ_30576 [Oryza sativa Japonica Group]|uniref:Uncharacterized protein n=1 Tax=Oryza sativa subsp. japonica TaxID=39947 RepID=B9G7B1_ORYSJ|nr:hypothetical protein OsJ_30576 [Oryza sativa Japonica Group]
MGNAWEGEEKDKRGEAAAAASAVEGEGEAAAEEGEEGRVFTQGSHMGEMDEARGRTAHLTHPGATRREARSITAPQNSSSPVFLFSFFLPTAIPRLFVIRIGGIAVALAGSIAVGPRRPPLVVSLAGRSIDRQQRR